MLEATKGIVLQVVSYNDRYVIVHLYTDSFGRMACLMSRSRGKRTLVPVSLFRPLAILDLEVDQQNRRELQRIREARLAYKSSNMVLDPVKNAIELFVAEVLYRTVRTSESDPSFFNYLVTSIRILESGEEGVANFHIVFLLGLLHFIGIFPNTDHYGEGFFFDMVNGVFTPAQPSHGHFLLPDESRFFYQLLRISYANMSVYRFSRTERVAIVKRILDYYRLHFPDFPEIKSFAVLQDLFV